MKILMLQDDLFDYLNRIVYSHAAAGINPEEGLAIYHLHQALKSAQTVDEAQVAKVRATEVAGIPIATVAVEAPVETECPRCHHDWDRHTGHCHFIADASGDECGCRMKQP